MVERFGIQNHSLCPSPEGNIYYYYNVDSEEKEFIEKTFDIDEHSLASALDVDEVARFEFEENEYTIIWKSPTPLILADISSLNIMSIGFFVRKGNLIIISNKKLLNLPGKPPLHMETLTDVIFFFQYHIIRNFTEHLKIIKLMSREIQEKINTSMQNEYLLQMFHLSEILTFYLEALNGNQKSLTKFQNYLFVKAIPCDEDFLGDLLIETEQAAKQAEIYSEVFASLMDARASIINNNMNVLIKNLTIINIIFLPLNLIASIGGMSEYSVMTQGIPWPISYGLFCLAMVLIGWLTYRFITRLEEKQKK
ncbi:Magnesium and cobalt transport protein CorA [Brevinematales bacterium NS]|nr:magnesium transporter CorA family protein [Brevinematales bacterium]QJR21854.1 Magnesium and cobalt transport protein CorA [Brevinematales bacterium NS]